MHRWGQGGQCGQQCSALPWCLLHPAGAIWGGGCREELADYDPFDDGSYCRSRFWLFVSYVVSFGSIVGAVWVLLQHYGERMADRQGVLGSMHQPAWVITSLPTTCAMAKQAANASAACGMLAKHTPHAAEPAPSRKSLLMLCLCLQR